MRNLFSTTDKTCKDNFAAQHALLFWYNLFNYMRLLNIPCGIIVNFYPSFATIERYFYDSETREMLTSNGNPFQSTTNSAGELAHAT